MGRLIADFGGSGEARIATQRQRFDQPDWLKEITKAAVGRVRELKTDRPIVPGYELSILSDARAEDVITINAVKQQIQNRNLSDDTLD